MEACGLIHLETVAPRQDSFVLFCNLIYCPLTPEESTPAGLQRNTQGMSFP